MPVQKQIRPNQVWVVPLFSSFFAAALLSLVLSIVFLVIYVGKHTTQMTEEGVKLYKPVSKTYLITSVSFSILTLVFSIVCFIRYYKIFGGSLSWALSSVLFVAAGGLGVLVASIVYLAKKERYCPDGKQFNKEFNMCVDICAKGSRLTTGGKCTAGCLTADDCPDNHGCVNGSCCDLSRNKILNQNQCCPREHVKIINGKETCCPLQCGAECCQDAETFQCDPSGQKCMIKCGGATCDPETQYCLNSPARLSDPTKSGVMSECVARDPVCSSELGSRQNAPALINGFYPAFDSAINTSKDTVSTILNNVFGSEASKNALQGFTEEGNKGYICGLSTPIMFQGDKFQKCNDKRYCLDQVYYPFTQQMTVFRDEKDGTMYCNQQIDPNATVHASTAGPSKVASPGDPEASYTTTTAERDTDGVVRATTQKVNFKTDLGGASPRNSLKATQGAAPCTDKNVYQRQCGDVGSCFAKKECPFDNKGDNYACTYENNVGFITLETPVKMGCQVVDGSFVCAPDPEGRYELCSDKKNCDDSVSRKEVENNKRVMNSDVCTASIQRDANGNYVKTQGGPSHWGISGSGRDCDLQKKVQDSYDGQACPQGFQPFFWMGPEGKNNHYCRTHSGYKREIHFKCVDPEIWKNKQTFADVEPSGEGVIPQDFKMNWRFSSDSDTTTDVYTGRAGTNNDCADNPNYPDLCNLNHNKCAVYMGSVLNQINGITFGWGPDWADKQKTAQTKPTAIPKTAARSQRQPNLIIFIVLLLVVSLLTIFLVLRQKGLTRKRS